MTRRRLLLPIFTALILAVPASAQPGPGPGGNPRFRERIEELRKVRLIEMLELTENQSVRFFARFSEHERARQALLDQKNEALDKIERLVRNHADSTEYEQVFPAVLAFDTKLAEENTAFFNSLRDILTIEQRAKYLLFERRFQRELREAMRETLRERHRMQGP